MKVPLADVVFLWVDPVVVSGQEDSFALTTVLRLNDERFGFSVVKLLFESLIVAGQKPCRWKKLVIFWQVTLHRQQILSEQILSTECVHARKVVGPLPRFHFHQ